MTLILTHVCSNCQTWTDAELCSPCRFLKQDVKYAIERLWGENQGMFNRRWQMYFNRGELHDDDRPANGWPTSPLWERRRKEQDW